MGGSWRWEKTCPQRWRRLMGLDAGPSRTRERKGIKKQLGLPANPALSPRSLYSDRSRCTHDAGGLPGLLRSRAGVPVHAGIGECPLHAHRPWPPRSPSRGPINHGVGRVPTALTPSVSSPMW